MSKEILRRSRSRSDHFFISSRSCMWEDEVLQAIGDSIWGRLTLLISSLVGHKCTARERADAYEALLLSSINDNDKEMAQIPVESLIDEATENFMKTGDNSAVKKFRRTVERLRANDDENDGIIRFLLLMANWDAVSATLLESGGGRPLRDTLNIPGYRRRCPSLEFSMDGSRKRETKVSFTMSPVVHTLSFQGSTSSVCTSSVSDGEKMALEELIFDERGNVHPLASGQAIRSLWLPPGSTFEMVSWYDFIVCLQSLVRGEECSIFEGGTRGSPHILRHSRSILSLEFEGPLALMRFASPFLAFANKLREVNNFLCCEDRPPDEWCSSDCALHLRPFHILSFHLQDCLRKIRDELSREIAADIDMYCDRVEAMGRMRKVLLKSRAFSYFCDIILTIRQRADYGCSALIDVFFSARTLLGNVEEDMGKLCDEVLLVLVRHFHQSILKWLCKGDDSLSEGVFRSRFSDMMMMAKETPLLTRSNIGDVVKLWRNDFGLSLPSNGLLSEEFCAKWMLEGKMRKMMKLWRTVDSNIAETMPVYELKIDAENEVESDRLLEAINSKQPDRAVQTLLSEKYAAIVNMPPARRLRRDIMDSFRATLMFIERTFLCKDGFFIDGIVSALQRMRCIQENDSATESVNEMRNPSREGSVTESIYSSLSGDGYTERIVRGLRVVVSLGDTHAMRLRYEPAFPLQIIFTQSTLSTYEELWMLMASLMFECIALDELDLKETFSDWRTMLMRSRMRNFLNGLLVFIHNQIDYVFSCTSLKNEAFNADTVEEAYNSHKQLVTSLRRLCFLGAKHGMFVSVLNDCILSVTNFREAISNMDKKGVEIAFMEFDENAELFCNAVKMQSKGNDFWLANLLLFVDSVGYYTNTEDSHKMGCSSSSSWMVHVE